MKIEAEEFDMGIIAFAIIAIFFMFTLKGCEVNNNRLEYQLWKATNTVERG